MQSFESKQVLETDLLRLLSGSRDESDVVCDIRDWITKITGAKTVDIFQAERRLNRFYRWTKEGPDGSTEALHRQDPLVVLAEREARVLRVQDWADLPIPEGRPDILSELQILLPLVLGRNLIGIVAIGPFTQDAATFIAHLEFCRGPLAMLLEMLRLKALVIDDPATATRSHDYFSLRLNDEIDRAHRYESKVSLVMLRLVGLTEQLEGVPPLVSERIMRQVGRILLENTRRSNVVARFISDPEIFQIMMPEIPGETANKLAESIAAKFSSSDLEGLNKPLSMYWGTATFPDDSSSRQILTTKAFTELKKAQEGEAKKSTPAAARARQNLPDFALELDMRNPEMLSIFETAFRIADSKSTVLVQGETGVGKEVLAEFIHRCSGRKSKALVKVNCGALPESLLESELFGHEKGSFTGAEARRIGRFELAHEGTIFLDEIGELTLMAQVKLLRIIEGKTFYRLGGTTPVTSDVRIVAATNRDLTEEVQKGRFREDLYYRLNVITFTVPPLRQRREDIPALVARFMKDFNRENSSSINVIHPEAMDIFYRYDWPGNVRELKNAVERAMILAGGEGKIIARHLPPSVLKGANPDAATPASSITSTHPAAPGGYSESLRFPDLNERQRQVIEFLRVHNFVSNQQYVNMMNVSRRTCVRDLNELIDRKLVVREGKKKSCVYRLADGV